MIEAIAMIVKCEFKRMVDRHSAQEIEHECPIQGMTYRGIRPPNITRFRKQIMIAICKV